MGFCMMIPLSVVDDVLLFAIPMIASFINFVSDSTINLLPRIKIFPVTSRLEDITVASPVVVINESFKNLSAATYGTLPAVKPSILRSPPTSMFAVVTRPVVAFENCTTFVVVFPLSVTPWRSVTIPESLLPSPSK